MTHSRYSQNLTLAALAILAASCLSNNAQNGGSGGSKPSVGGASGGATSSGGQVGTGGSAPGVGGKGSGGSASGGAAGSTSGGSGSGGSGSGGVTSGAGGSSPAATGGSSSGSGAASDAGLAVARQILNLNQFWKFIRSDASGAQAVAFDDSSWGNVGLPHSFSVPYFMTPSFYVGYGWYRIHFTVRSSWSGKSVFLEFQGAFDQTQVYVNGTQAVSCSAAACTSTGEHLGGYNGFSYDISSAITTGNNVVAVRLNNNWNPQVAPLSGDHTFQGGLYRDVNVVVTDPLHITWYGTWVTTPTLATNSGASSTVEIKTEVQNSRSAAVDATLTTDIVDSSGKVVATVSSQQQIAAGATVTFNQTTPAVSNPSLWHPDHPTMYQAVSSRSDSAGLVDNFTTPFGFRWLSWTAEQGFFLNGSHYWINGGNVHQDHAGWGAGVADSALYRDVQLVKQAGLNFIRGSHYPKAPAFADACDQLGVMLWSENCFWGGLGGTWQSNDGYPGNSTDQAPFDANVLASLTDMIRIHRNHPSIVAWSMGNEDFFAQYSGPAANVVALLQKEVALTHQLDPQLKAGTTWGPGRPAAIGGTQVNIGNTNPATLGDVAGFNGDGLAFPDPGMPNLISEYGSPAQTRPGDYDPGWENLAVTNNMPTQYAWRSGASKWCVFDYGSQMGTTYITTGMVDYFRIPKRAWYWYRNTYANVAPPTWPASGKPAGLKLTSNTTTLTAVDGTQDAWLNVTVVDSSGTPINNTVPVTLTVTSGWGQFPTGPSITFTPLGSASLGSGAATDISMIDGQAAIEFRTYYSGTSVITATSPGLTSISVTITSQGSPAFVQGQTPPADSRPYTGRP